MGLAKWLGLEDDDVTERKRVGGKLPIEKRGKPRFDRGVRTHYEGTRVVRGKRRGRRDPDLPDALADNFTGTYRDLNGKRVRYRDGIKQ